MAKTAHFKTVRLREGYDIDDVDSFLALAEQRRDEGTITVDFLRNARFAPTRIRRGYDSRTVDDWLDGVIEGVQMEDDAVTAKRAPLGGAA